MGGPQPLSAELSGRDPGIHAQLPERSAQRSRSAGVRPRDQADGARKSLCELPALPLSRGRRQRPGGQGAHRHLRLRQARYGARGARPVRRRSLHCVPGARAPDQVRSSGGTERNEIHHGREIGMTQPRLKHFGWGREGEGITPEEEAFVWTRSRDRLRIGEFQEIKPPGLEEIELVAPRLEPPAALAGIASTERYDRVAHTYGKSYPDYVRGLLGDYAAAPDVVVYPRNQLDIAAVLDWADAAQASVTPFGGGSSVAGGVEPRADGLGRYRAAVTIDLRDMNRVIEVDRTSRAARIEAGAFGPALEAELKPHGLTLRHFPQSFEFSTLGGWIATRAGGHFATLFTHIDDLVESLRVVTPRGTIETRRLPGSGAGPSPDRLLIGSEGILGVITQAWMRLQDRPRFRAGGSVRFKDFFSAARAVR